SPFGDRPRPHRHDRRGILHRPRRSRLSDHLVRERFPYRPHVRPGHRRRDDGHPDDGFRAMARGSYRAVAKERAMRGSSKMHARAVGSIGLGLAILVASCGGGGGGAATPSTAAVAVGPGIKSMADLKGKKMRVQEPGGFADVMTRIVLKKAGLDPAKDVTFVTTTTAGRVQALATGTTDTAVLHIDQIKTVQKQTPTITVLANMWEVLTDYQYSVYIVPTQVLKAD